MKHLFKTRKGVALLVTTAAIAVVGGAYAYFTIGGSGTGSAQSATPAALIVKQVGPGFDSLVPVTSTATSPYIQDQCFQCAQITALGDEIHLANPGYQRLGNVIVAFRNWNAGFSDVPITLSIVGGPTVQTTPTIAPVLASGRPSVTEVTFNFNGAWVDQDITYQISFDASGHAGGLNVALSSSANQVSAGSVPHPGTLWVATTAGAGIAGDFPACTTPGVGFAAVNTACGVSASGNPGAYGNQVGPGTNDADIPAVEFNVLGGTIAGLSPGVTEPIEFAIINPGTTTVHVNSISTTVSSVTAIHTGGGIEACTASLFQIAGSAATVNTTVPPGTTVLTAPSGTSISMPDDGNNQNNCEGATVNLAFTSN